MTDLSLGEATKGPAPPSCAGPVRPWLRVRSQVRLSQLQVAALI